MASGELNVLARKAPRVAVIDDDPDIRLTIAVALECAGFDVTTYEDGQSALDGVTQRPELILLDYMMPRLNAEGFLRARLHHQLLRGVPVVVISAYPELVELVVAETVGVLHKPLDLEILLECVAYHCNRAPGPFGAGGTQRP
jgi:two-component system, OmpR family, response regulator ChvI